MEILNNTDFKYMKYRKIAIMGSTLLIVLSITSMILKGFELGLDFTGGTLLEIGYPVPVKLDDVRSALSAEDFDDVIIQHFGSSSEITIRIPPRENIQHSEILSKSFGALTKQEPGLVKRKVEFIGPQVGEELTEKGGMAMIIALIFILIYVGLRFEYRFAWGAVAALVHDVVIILGFFSLFSIQFDLTVLAALLAVIGYSLNDTIVVFDRIRENFRKLRQRSSAEIIDVSLNQTLSRTLITSLTTLFVLLSLFTLGGEAIHGFATALLVGVLIGTYSSIFVASSILVEMGIRAKDLEPVKPEGDKHEEVYEEIE